MFLGVLALAYWLLIFVTINVFDLKIFREKLTELFAFSILGILALIAASFLFNIVSNLTIIADSVHKDTKSEIAASKFHYGWYLISMPIVILLLFSGHWLTVKKKESLLLRNAEEITKKYEVDFNTLLDYKFSEKYLKTARNSLYLMSKFDEHFPEVSIVFQVSHKGKQLFVCFDSQSRWSEHDTNEETDHICRTGKNERAYMNKIFTNAEKLPPLFESNAGHYKLFYPVKQAGRTGVLVLSDYQRYGKIGS